MSKMTFTKRLKGDYIADVYPDTMSSGANGKGTKGWFKSDEDGSRVLFAGKKITADGDGFSGGTVEQITFTNSAGKAYATIVGEYKLSVLSDAFMSKGFEAILKKALKGQDTLIGSDKDDSLYGYSGRDILRGGKGEDWLGGGAGDDILIGGAGHDMYFLGWSDGHDTVRGFDAIGGQGKQDHVMLPNGAKYTISANSDKDAVVTLSDGSSMTLLGVARKDVTADDIWFS